MKKTIFLLGVLFAFIGKAMAQNQALPDGKFEQWEQKNQYGNVGTYDDLANPFWSSLNILSTLPPDQFSGPVTLFKEVGRSGAGGDFSAKMVSNEMVFGQDEQYIFLPGVIGAITVWTDKQTATFGRPFVSHPKALKGYIKYLPVEGDSASIFVELYKYNEEAGKRQTIARVEKIIKDTLSEWTPFELPIEYVNQELNPDSVTVLFVASAGFHNFEDLFKCEGQVGSTLWVDDVEFVYEGGDPSANENPVLASSKLYPNPSNGVFNLNVEAACNMEVVAISGQLVMQQNLQTPGAYTIDLSRFAPGIYYIRLSNREGAAVLKALKR